MRKTGTIAAGLWLAGDGSSIEGDDSSNEGDGKPWKSKEGPESSH